jgi:hypothetical protein
MISTFVEEPELIVMKPSSIDFVCFPETVKLTITALRHWSQLQYIKLTFYELSWQDVLKQGFMNQENLICPELVHLRMDLRGHTDDGARFSDADSDFESDEVTSFTEFPEEMAQEMLEVRRETPLQIVEWRSYHSERDSEWHMLKKSEQGIQHYALFGLSDPDE